VRRGFTLMEMMVVVAIIVALAGIGIFFLAPQADEGNKTKAKADIKSLTQAALQYKMQHAGQWPQTLEALIAKDESGYGPYIHKEEDLLTPWPQLAPNGKYTYDPSGTRNNGLQPDIFCQSPHGIICNWSNRILPQ
jgi:prepilin-type N-terminal cleavage/methylation domain-containing protein